VIDVSGAMSGGGKTPKSGQMKLASGAAAAAARRNEVVAAEDEEVRDFNLNCSHLIFSFAYIYFLVLLLS
jgi:hypothetical protein